MSGRAAALDRLKCCWIKLDITEGGQTIQGHYAADIAGLVLIDIRVAGKLVYREGVDNKGVWLWPSQDPAPRESAAQGAANAPLHGIEGNLVGLHRFAERGHKLKFLPPQKIDGRRNRVVEVVFKTGHTSYFYIDPSWLITRKRDERAYHPDVDQTKNRVESRYSDFKSVEGVTPSDRNEDYDLNAGTLLAVNQVTQRIWNPELAPQTFDRNFIPV